MSAATLTTSLDEIRETLRELYPRPWAACLIPLCKPSDHTHSVREKDEWIDKPCPHPGKRPIDGDWNGKAMERLRAQTPPVSNEAEQQLDEHVRDIAKHVADGGNVGLVMPPGVMVLDIDDEASMTAAENIAELQDAPRQLTRKGAHLVTQVPPEAKDWGQQVKVQIENGMRVDLRLPQLGQIVVEPSVHATGVPYRWDRELPPTRSSLPMLSDGMVRMIDEGLRAKKMGKATGNRAISADGKIGEGERNTFLIGEAGLLVSQGIVADELLVRLLGLNALRCEPPLPESEVRAIHASASMWEPGGSTGTDGPKPKQIDQLLTLFERVEFFRSPTGDAFVDIMVERRRETHRIKSAAFRQWLRRENRATTGRTIDPKQIDQAIDEGVALALDEGDERDVHVRIAGSVSDTIFVDLGDDLRRVVKIDATGWTVVEYIDVPVRFRRPKSMSPLPRPVKGGNVQELMSFVNISVMSSFKLLVGFILGALNPAGPYAFFGIRGEHGTAKTTLAKIIQRLIDPSSSEATGPPSNQRDAVLMANSSHLLNIDNISTIQPWFSDMLCRLSTGASMAFRALYTDDELAVFTARRPVVLNGITSVVDRPDLADRCVFITLETVPPDKRRLESEVLADFDAARPRILGALFDAVAHGIRELPNTHLAEMPRMADFAKWVTACEGALWESGEFMDAYNANQFAAVEEGIDASLVGSAVRDFMGSRSESVWEGRCQDLLKELTLFRGWAEKRPSDWPTSSQKLSPALDRAAAPLRRIGIAVTRARRKVILEKVPTDSPYKSSKHVEHVEHVISPLESATYGVTRSPSSPAQHVEHVMRRDEVPAEHVMSTSAENHCDSNGFDVRDEVDEVAGVPRGEDMGWGESLDEGDF